MRAVGRASNGLEKKSPYWKKCSPASLRAGAFSLRSKPAPTLNSNSLMPSCAATARRDRSFHQFFPAVGEVLKLSFPNFEVCWINELKEAGAPAPPDPSILITKSKPPGWMASTSKPADQSLPDL